MTDTQKTLRVTSVPGKMLAFMEGDGKTWQGGRYVGTDRHSGAQTVDTVPAMPYYRRALARGDIVLAVDPPAEPPAAEPERSNVRPIVSKRSAGGSE